MDKTCNTQDGENKYLEHFNLEIWGEEAIWNKQAYVGG